MENESTIGTILNDLPSRCWPNESSVERTDRNRRAGQALIFNYGTNSFWKKVCFVCCSTGLLTVGL